MATKTIEIMGHSVIMTDGTKPSILHGDCPLCGEKDACHANVDKGFFYCFGCRRKGTLAKARDEKGKRS